MAIQLPIVAPQTGRPPVGNGFDWLEKGVAMNLPQQGIAPRTDLREMLRGHIVGRALACMERAAARRAGATASPEAMVAYREAIRAAVRGFYGELPAGAAAPPPEVTPVAAFPQAGFRIENVLFETYPGWQVNATVYVPTAVVPPFPVVIVPVGHSGKQFANYQLPCQYFARAGYLAICFDPPGQASEKQPGNDHFNDGVRDYLIGRTSSRYFVADALRCIDYAATRTDIDLSRGVAMTGVSGGGTTTTFAALLDDRIAVIGPSCCVTPLADLDICQCYAGCPETHQIRRYAEGIDEVDLICAAAPLPCLLMAGEADEIFHIEDTRKLADIAAGFYTVAGVPERFDLAVDPGGHAYPLEQARVFARFMNRWLRHEPDRAVPELPDATFALRPYEELQCRPRTDVNLRTLAVAEADALAASRDRAAKAVRAAAAKLAGIAGPVEIPEAEIGPPFQVWTHDWRSVMLRPEADIELPATLLTTRSGEPAATILHLDDAGRHRLLDRQGALCVAMRFLDRDRPGFNLLTVDLRGWGDTAPAMYPYEMAGWGGLDRYAAYATAALGDPLMAMRIRDALAALAWLRARPEVAPARIVLTGSGVGAIVALQVAAIDADLAGVVGLDGLSSFRSLIAAERYPWPADVFLPGVLRHYDLPELAAAIPAPIHLHNLCDGAGQAADEGELRVWHAIPNATVSSEAKPFPLAECMATMAANGAAYRHLRRGESFLWINPGRQPVAACLDALPLTAADIADAEARWQRLAPLLETLFPELRSSHGVIESPLLPAPKLAERILPPNGGRLFIKADHALPVAGSIKARGGIYAVLHFAEHVALEHGLLADERDDYRKLASPQARTLFAGYELSVGSTGNLGLSIGIAGAALGFQVAIHMSVEAKEWKKERLRRRGVKVVEHASDYTAACVVARAAAAANPRQQFIDDENSVELFLGYACAVPRLKRQLAAAGIAVDRQHPLFIYLPCGVGGGPGGITFAARHEFGDNVHCFFVEPVEAPCMTLGMLTGRHADISVYSLGLGLKTDADGLAVSTPSRFVGQLMAPLLDGCCTLEDRTLYHHLLDLYESEGIEVEPSAAAGCGVPRLLFESRAAAHYWQDGGLCQHLPQATHIVWTTGGSFVPPEQHRNYREACRPGSPP